MTSVVAQVIVPMSSSLAAEHERGPVVGTVMSGLLIGILLARTVSGLIAAAFGWRVGVLVRRRGDGGAGRDAAPRAAAGPADDRAVLRRPAALGACRSSARSRCCASGWCSARFTFGCFSTLWTSLAFLLSGAPYNYGNGVIGLFGLSGVAGAAAASVAGRLADRGHDARVTTATLLVMLASWGVLARARPRWSR